MSLYDDFDKHRTTEKVAGWSSGIKLLQSQLQLKKAATTQPKREQYRKATAVLAPVIDLKSKGNRENSREDEGSHSTAFSGSNVSGIGVGGEFDWNVINEYDPMWPNEYEKAVKELREMRDREHDQETEMRKRRRDSTRFEDNQVPSTNSNNSSSTCSSNNNNSSSSTTTTNTMIPPERDEERTSTSRATVGGAAIAPPPSLQESSDLLPPVPRQTTGMGYATSSVAAKIMAKYGFKEGQGLGKKEQGMSVALQVEKTSKRGGRIVGEREQLMPPPPAVASPPPMQPQIPSMAQPQLAEEPSITEIMKSPSKVVLLRNMVGPGEVDEDLEPEVKDECNTKYGDVARVIIHEIAETIPEEAVRIFVEFKRIESAIKAVVDLNGRFFGGRQVKAGFYSTEKLDDLQ